MIGIILDLVPFQHLDRVFWGRGGGISYGAHVVANADFMVPVESRIPKPVSYTSSVPGSLPSHLAFGRRNHRVTLPKRCNPFIGESEFRLVVNGISSLFDIVLIVGSLHAMFHIERDADLRPQAEKALSTTSTTNGRILHNDVFHCLD